MSQRLIDKAGLKTDIIEAIRTVYDPELPVNVYDLGLIYKIEVDEQAVVQIEMTLTTPSCPEAQTLPANVEAAVRSVERVNDVKLELVWDPPWTKDCIPEETRLVLGIF